MSSLGGVPLHPTPLYSMLWMLVTGAILLRLWVLGAPLPFIAGGYLVLVGLGRFVEEHYRGEPQTAIVGGLRLYQWLAMAFVFGGSVLMAIDGRPAPRPSCCRLVSLGAGGIHGRCSRPWPSEPVSRKSSAGSGASSRAAATDAPLMPLGESVTPIPARG